MRGNSRVFPRLRLDLGIGILEEQSLITAGRHWSSKLKGKGSIEHIERLDNTGRTLRRFNVTIDSIASCTALGGPEAKHRPFQSLISFRIHLLPRHTGKRIHGSVEHGGYN